MPTVTSKSRATLHTSMGEMTLEFLVKKAPRTVDNFVRLARKGFYDGTTFHRVLKGFMVQGGCPKGDGTGGPGYTIGPEFNDTPHVQGVVSMARSNDPHSAGSQFFIVHDESRYLDSKYAAFAKVVEGLEVLEKIASAPVVENRWKELSQPRDPIYVNRIELEGVEFEEDELAELLGQRRDEGGGRPGGNSGGGGQASGGSGGQASGEGSGSSGKDADDAPRDDDDANAGGDDGDRETKSKRSNGDKAEKPARKRSGKSGRRPRGSNRAATAKDGD